MIKNIEAARGLVEIYRGVTLERIKAVDSENWVGGRVAHMFVGFGSPKTCSLCMAVDLFCDNCIYSATNGIDGEKYYYCLKGDNRETYFAIIAAMNPEQLLQAFKDRADYIEKLIKRIEND